MAARGIRNNNPLNIRRGDRWQGMLSLQADDTFVQFESMQYGLRAGMKVLKNYITGNNSSHKRFTTVNTIISRWAPASENNTEAYIRTVVGLSGIGRFDRISFFNKGQICRLVRAMAFVEVGSLLPMEQIESAYDLV